MQGGITSLWFNSPDNVKGISREKSMSDNGMYGENIRKQWGLVCTGCSDMELKTLEAGKVLCALWPE